MPAELSYSAEFAWVKTGETAYRLELDSGITVSIELTMMGHWETTIDPGSIEPHPMPGWEALHDAVSFAEIWVSARRPEALPLVDSEARWRRSPASTKQLALAARRGIEAPPEMTKGQASHLIAMLAKD